MEWNKDNIINIVQFINDELNNGRTMVSIEQNDFKTNKRVIHKRLSRLGYKRINNQYTTNQATKEDITSNITPQNNPIAQVKESNYGVKKQNYKNDHIHFDEYDMDKLKLLLDNIDILLKLIPNLDSNITSNMGSLRSGVNNVISLRADTGLYALIKERAARDKVNIADIINKSLEDYLKTYL